MQEEVIQERFVIAICAPAVSICHFLTLPAAHAGLCVCPLHSTKLLKYTMEPMEPTEYTHGMMCMRYFPSFIRRIHSVI